MIYRSSSLLSKNDNAFYSVAEMAQTPETYLECLLQLNEEFQEAENEYNIAYYRALKESALNESTDLVLNEGLISKAVEMLSKIIQAILNFIKKIIAKLRGSKIKEDVAKAKQVYNEKISSGEKKQGETAAQGAGKSEDPYQAFLNTKRKFTYYHFADWNTLDASIVLQGCQMLIQHVEDLCQGRDIAAPDPAHFQTALKGMAVKIMKSATVPEPSQRKEQIPLDSSANFLKYIETNVIYRETREVTGQEFVKAYEDSIVFGRNGFYNEKLCSDIEKRLYDLQALLKRTNTALKPENVKYAQQYLNYFKECATAWISFINRNELVHSACVKYFTAQIWGSNPQQEASTIHGELFNSDTLFANEDPRDFNRTEWLDLELTAEAFCFNQAVNEARRSMAVQEAIILSENSIDTFRKLQAMQEAEINKLANAISEIIKRVKEFVMNFINDLQDKHGPNAAFMKRHAELIKKPFKIQEVSSTGNIIDGIARMNESRQISFNPATMNEDNKADMFKAHFLASFSSKASGGKRPVKWDDGITISDYCKAFYGASMPADQYPPVKYNTQELNAGKESIIKFMEAPHNLFSKIKQELNELEKEAKKAGAESVRPNATVNNTAQTGNDAGQQNANAGNNAQGTSDGAQQESMFYSVLYDKWFTEADTNMGATNNAGGDSKDGGAEGESKKQNNSKVYIECLKDILLAKLTAARFIYSECNQLVRAHAKSYMSKEQAAAEAKNEKGAAGNNQNAKQQPQNQAQG